MELEKTLFRVHQKILSDDGAATKIKICSLINFIIGGVFFISLIISDLAFRNSPGLIGSQFNEFMEECFDKNSHLRSDFVYSFILCDYDPVELAEGHKAFQESQGLDKCDQKLIKYENNDGENSMYNQLISDGENQQKKFLLDNQSLIEDVQKGGVQENLDNQNNSQKNNKKNNQLLDDSEEFRDGENQKIKKLKQSNTNYIDGEEIIHIDGFHNNQVNMTNTKTKISKQFRIFDPSEYCKSDPTLYLYMSAYDSLIKFPREYKNDYSLLEMKFIRSEDDFADNVFLRMFYKYIVKYENIYILDIINTFKYQDIHIKNVNTTEHWGFSQGQKAESYSIYSRMIIMFFNFLKINIGLFLTSAITSIYIKTTIICAPVFILSIIACLNRLGNQDITRITLYRAFPWIGLYLYTLDQQSSKTSYLVKSFLCLIFLFYCIYLSSSIYIAEFSFFYKSIPLGLDENFFGFQAFLEFGILIFIRTRSGIKWYPGVTIMLILSFLIYIQQTVYGFYYLAYNALLFTCFGYLGLIIYFFEVPAMTWNPSFNFTPTAERPRTLYFPLYSMHWLYDLPQLWTMFYPLHGRKFFSQDQLSLVDRDYVRLNNYLRNGPQQNQQQQFQQFNVMGNLNLGNNDNIDNNANNNANNLQNNNGNLNNNEDQRAGNEVDQQNIRILNDLEQRNQNENNNNNSGSLLRDGQNSQIELGPLNSQNLNQNINNNQNNRSQEPNYIRMRNQDENIE